MTRSSFVIGTDWLTKETNIREFVRVCAITSFAGAKRVVTGHPASSSRTVDFLVLDEVGRGAPGLRRR